MRCGMNVHVLTFEVGISSGHKELIGIFETEEKAEEALGRHMRKYCYSRHDYFIKEIELNKEVNITLADW